METREARLLYRPVPESWGYLPEGPYALGADRFSWITIQTSATSVTGALHRFDLARGVDEVTELPGRPGFAFPTDQSGKFLIGLERRVVLFDIASGAIEPLTEEIDKGAAGTIINDAVLFDEGLVFGAKELTFSQKIAGLYLLRRRDLKLFRLRDDQICSNGKFIRPLGGDCWELFDIDTPTRQVVRYELDVATGRISEPTIALELSHVNGFPDGMIQVPGREEVIVAMFDPAPAPCGFAIRFSLTTGQPLERWRVAGAPQVTCPQLVQSEGGVKLILSTAAENLSPERLAQQPHSGSLFIADVDYDSTGDQPSWHL